MGMEVRQGRDAGKEVQKVTFQLFTNVVRNETYLASSPNSAVFTSAEVEILEAMA
jgi:hypothetical protein